MARRSAEALAKQKEARQKKMLLILAPVLLLMLAWQGPGMLKAFTGGDPPPEAAPAPAPAPQPGAAPAPAPDPTAAAPPTTAGGGPSADPAAPAGALPDTDVPVEPGTGQLVAFDRFVGKDPFRQQVVAREGEGGDGAGSGGGGGGGGGDASKDDSKDGSGSGSGSGGDPTAPPPGGSGDGGSDDAERTSATVDVNGSRQEVFVSSTFPTIDPIFRVVSISAKSAKIELVTGQFSNGRGTLTLKLRKPLTLVSQPDGLRYVVTLLATGRNSQ